MKLAISSDLRSRYSAPDISVLLDKCTFLDPRFRAGHLVVVIIIITNYSADQYMYKALVLIS